MGENLSLLFYLWPADKKTRVSHQRAKKREEEEGTDGEEEEAKVRKSGWPKKLPGRDRPKRGVFGFVSSWKKKSVTPFSNPSLPPFHYYFLELLFVPPFPTDRNGSVRSLASCVDVLIRVCRHISGSGVVRPTFSLRLLRGD